MKKRKTLSTLSEVKNWSAFVDFDMPLALATYCSPCFFFPTIYIRMRNMNEGSTNTHVDPRVRPRTSGTVPNRRRPHKRAIVVGYDNELNMPTSGMCENEPVWAQKMPLFPQSFGPPCHPPLPNPPATPLHRVTSIQSAGFGGRGEGPHLAAAQHPPQRYADEGGGSVSRVPAG